MQLRREKSPASPTNPGADRSRRVQIDFGGIPAVDLLPASERARRATKRLVRRWIGVGIGAIFLVAAVSAAGFWMTMEADKALEAQRADTEKILAEIAQFQDLSAALGAEAKLTGHRAKAMATDIDWRDLHAELEAELPDTAEIVGLGLAPGGPPSLGDSAGVAVGLVTQMRVSSPEPLHLATIIERLQRREAVIDVQMNSLDQSDEASGDYLYVTTILIDQSIYSGRFDNDGGPTS